MNGVMGLSYDVICERKSVCLDLRALGISVAWEKFYLVFSLSGSK